MPWLGVLVSVAAALGLLVWLVRRERELFRLRVERGRVRSARGRLPAALRAELTDVLGRAGATGLLVGFRSEGRVAIRAVGLDDPALLQRLRNVVGRFPLARVAAAARNSRHKPARGDEPR